MINKIFASILVFALILPKISLAEEQQFDYEHLTTGSCVTSDGFFFTEQGMITLVINTKEKIRLATLNGQKQIDLLKVDLRSCSESKETELRVQKQMFEKQLAVKQQTIDAYKSDAYWYNAKIAGAVVVGFSLGALTFIFINAIK